MTDETVAAQAEGEALPASDAKPPEPGFLARAESAVLSLEQRVVAGIDAWYAEHFHSAAAAGRAPISAVEKASLTKHVSAALTPKE